MELKNVICEKENGIALITINRPKALNALNSETLSDLNSVIEDLEKDDEIKVAILTGSGDKAYRKGLVNKVVAPEALLDEAKSMAKKIAANASIAVKLCKDAIDRGIQGDIDSGIMIEAEDFGRCFSTVDQKEGMTAFLEKREKKFVSK